MDTNLNSNPEKNKISLQEAYQQLRNYSKAYLVYYPESGGFGIVKDKEAYQKRLDEHTAGNVAVEYIPTGWALAAPSILESHLAIYNLIAEIPEQDRTIIELTAMKYAETAIRKALNLPSNE